jgi:hypothetical protein
MSLLILYFTDNSTHNHPRDHVIYLRFLAGKLRPGSSPASNSRYLLSTATSTVTVTVTVAVIPGSYQIARSGLFSRTTSATSIHQSTLSDSSIYPTKILTVTSLQLPSSRKPQKQQQTARSFWPPRCHYFHVRGDLLDTHISSVRQKSVGANLPGDKFPIPLPDQGLTDFLDRWKCAASCSQPPESIKHLVDTKDLGDSSDPVTAHERALDRLFAHFDPTILTLKKAPGPKSESASLIYSVLLPVATVTAQRECLPPLEPRSHGSHLSAPYLAMNTLPRFRRIL